mmetsp:Transcript_17738/g.44289  ORF Transcript_17738/g.44289 Transcript_17738/m.44289 type:complete len:305 (-) Transcript_17738:463-1377(-)
MARLLELVEQLADVARPVVEHLVGRLRRLERDDAGGPVDAREDLLLRHHLAQLLLHLLHGETRELRQPGHADPAVVARDDLYVVLRDARVHRLEHQLALLVGELGKEGELGLEPRLELGEVEDLLRDEELEQLLEHRQLLQLLLRREPLHLVPLLLVVRREHQVDDLQLEAAVRGRLVALHRRRVEGRLVRGEDLEPVLHVPLVARDQLVVPDLEVLELGVLEDLDLDLPRHDVRADVVADGQAEPDLLEDELGLLALVHPAERLHLRVLHDLARLLYLALGLGYRSQRLREPRALHLDEDLAL